MKQPQLGHEIASLRRTRGLTQESLASSCGINVRSLQRIESGEVTPRMYTLKRLSEALEYQFQAETGKGELTSKKARWDFNSDQDISQALKTGWMAGILQKLFYYTKPINFLKNLRSN